MKVISYNTGRVIPGRFSGLLLDYPVTVVMVLAALLISLVPEFSTWATWQASAPFGPQVWLAHLAHWSPKHLLWDLLAFTILSVLLEKPNRRLLLQLLLWVPPAIIAAIWLAGDFTTYRGLSGLDCGLYSAALITLWRQNRMPAAMTLLATMLIIGKSAFEILTGGTVFVSDLPAGIQAVPVAHLAGALAGTGLAWMSGRRN